MVVEQDTVLHTLQSSTGTKHRLETPKMGTEPKILALPLTMLDLTTSPLSVLCSTWLSGHWKLPTAFCTPNVPKAQALISTMSTGNPPLSG